MKMARLIEDATSDLKEVKDNAVLYIGLILEKNSIENVDPRGYEGVLPVEFQSITLDTSAIKNVVDQLVEIMRLKGKNTAILWAMGKAHPSASTEALLGILDQWNEPYDTDEAKQAVMALGGVLDYDKSGRINRNLAARITSGNVGATLEGMAKCSNPHVAEYAKELLESAR